jgi:DNA topoisomerase-1
VKWTNVLDRFYRSFEKDLHKAEKEMKGEVLTDIACPKCKRPMAIKSGKNGLFLACTGYPGCKYTSNFSRDEKGRIVIETVPEMGEEAGHCERCGRPMVVKSGKFGPFLACSGYPDCKNTRPIAPTDEKLKQQISNIRCKMCGSKMVVRINRAGQKFLACEKYPACTHTEPITTDVSCPEKGCDGKLVERVSKKGRKFFGCSRFPECRFVMWDEPVDEICPVCNTRVLALKRPKEGNPYCICRRKGCEFKKPLPPASDD